MSKIKLPEYVQVVVNPYGSDSSQNRKGIMVGGTWVDEIFGFIKDNSIKAVYLNSAKGWKGVDYSFLSKLDTVEELNIISSTAEGLASIEGMNSLVELSVTTSTNDKVDFGKLPNLKKCYLYWWNGAESILGCAQLDTLYLDTLKLTGFSKLAAQCNLRSLTIANSQIDSLSWLKQFDVLCELEFYNCKKLAAFEAIKSCAALKKLVISRCSLLSDLSFVEVLDKLEILIVSDCGELDSLQPLEHLKNLKALSFAGNSIVKDGDLSVLVGLPNLSMLMFQGKKHYTHKLIKKWDWSNFNRPSVLLESKRA